MIPKETKFLILDDISAIRSMLKQHLKEIGIEVAPLEAETVAQAKSLIEKVIKGEEKIDFILSDWNLPDDNGLNFLKFVRNEAKLTNIPFVMVTTENEIDHMLDAVSAGCNNYVVKPWTIEDLREKVTNAWDSTHKAAPSPAIKEKVESIKVEATRPEPAKMEETAKVAKSEITKTTTAIKRPGIRPSANSVRPGKKGDEKNHKEVKKKSFWEKLFGK